MFTCISIDIFTSKSMFTCISIDLFISRPNCSLVYLLIYLLVRIECFLYSIITKWTDQYIEINYK